MSTLKESTTATVKLPRKLNHGMQMQIIRDGYGMRGRTRWILEAIRALLAKPHYVDLVDVASVMEDLEQPINFRCSKDVTAELDNAILRVRKQYPLMDGVKSNIIRAAICQRLIGFDLPPGEGRLTY